MPVRDPRKVFEQVFLQIGRENGSVLAVSCDSAKGAGMASFVKAFPERYVEAGISEQGAVGVCAGLSSQGYIPVLAAIAPFATMRCYEQIRDDIGYVGMNVKIVGSGGGLAYSTLGSTHEALEDVALMRTIPHMAVLCPGDGYEVAESLRWAVASDGPVYIRMPRQAREDIAPEEERHFAVGRAELIREGDRAAIFACGPSVQEAQGAAALLEREGVRAAVVDFTSVEPLDTAMVERMCRACPMIVTVEEHSRVGGLGSAVADAAAGLEGGCRLYRLAVPKGAKQVGPYREVVDFYGLSSRKIAEFVKARIAEEK